MLRFTKISSLLLANLLNIQLARSQNEYLSLWADLPLCGLNCARESAEINGCQISDSLKDVICVCSDIVFRNEYQRCIGLTCPREDYALAAGNLREICSVAPSPTVRPSSSSSPHTPSSTVSRASTRSPSTTTTVMTATVTNTSTLPPLPAAPSTRALISNGSSTPISIVGVSGTSQGDGKPSSLETTIYVLQTVPPESRGTAAASDSIRTWMGSSHRIYFFVLSIGAGYMGL